MTDRQSANQAGGTATERQTPQVGEMAPDFTLPDADGRQHRLADRRGSWTIVYFYPEDDTPGCTTEACQFRDLDAQIRDRRAEIWGISPDDAASHRRFREKYGLPFTLLSDTDHTVSEAYGAWGPKVLYGRETIGMIRSTYLVGPDGRIARAWPRVKADGHAATVLAALDEVGATAA